MPFESVSKSRKKHPQIVSLDDEGSYFAAYRLEDQITFTTIYSKRINETVTLGTLAHGQSKNAYIEISIGEWSLFLLKSDDNLYKMSHIGQQIASCDSSHTLFTSLKDLCKAGGADDYSLFIGETN